MNVQHAIIPFSQVDHSKNNTINVIINVVISHAVFTISRPLNQEDRPARVYRWRDLLHAMKFFLTFGG